MSAGSGPWLGILMLDTRFPRPPGDVGHPASWSMPVRWRRVQGASPRRVVRDADPALLEPFIETGRAMVAEGAAALTTSCGFLVRFQHALQAALPVPVWSSALLQIPALDHPGVLTVEASSLEAGALAAAGAAPDTPVEGLEPGSHLQDTLLNDRPELDIDRARADTVAAACRLVARHPTVRNLVLECTNLPPYADAVQAATGRPVHHLMTFVHSRWAALADTRAAPRA
ncbi:MAG: aspartate/glutamate racemase family protein [Ideonella sp.]|nr:aspartate/glutamate racemase family protein [Ideonella sp.]